MSSHSTSHVAQTLNIVLTIRAVLKFQWFEIFAWFSGKRIFSFGNRKPKSKVWNLKPDIRKPSYSAVLWTWLKKMRRIWKLDDVNNILQLGVADWSLLFLHYFQFTLQQRRTFNYFKQEFRIRQTSAPVSIVDLWN